MKLLRFIMFLFYRYYSTGRYTDPMPYISTLMAVSMLIYVHVFQVLILLDAVHCLPVHMPGLKIMKYGKLACYILPVFWLPMLRVRRKELKDAEYEEYRIRRGGTILVLYYLFAMFMWIVLVIDFAQ